MRDRAERIGTRLIRDHVPDEHKDLYARLPMLLIGALDGSGRPWASAVFGSPGFVSTPDPTTLSIAAGPLPGDPLADVLGNGRRVGVLGIEPHSRRRNRASGHAFATADGFDVRVAQSFGNCPRYIQPRTFEWTGTGGSEPRHITSLHGIAGVLIDRADTFFIATHHAGPVDEPTSGSDVSHRGGRPGFVRVATGQTLVFPDYPGNNFFNTLGNLQSEPRAGLLFPDFASGDLLYLTGTAQIRWDDPHTGAFDTTQRLVEFTLSHGWLLRRAMPIREKPP